MEHHSWQIWRNDKDSVKEIVKQDKGHDSFASAFGANDLLIGFMIVEGFWEILRDIETDGLKKENGYSPRTLNILWALCELARVGRIAHSGKVIGDKALLRIAGFQAEQINENRKRKGRYRIDPETLSNHLNRIGEVSVKKSWYKHVQLLKEKGWYRGKIYAVDGHEITIPYGKLENYKGAQKVGNKRGYKLITIINVTGGQERIIGWRLGGLAESERTMLKSLLKELETELGPIKEWMDMLLMDRGYWGTELLTNLKYKDGIEYVTRAGNDELDMVKDIEGLLKLDEAKWFERNEESRKYGEIKLKVTGMENVEMRPSDPIKNGRCNVVVADFLDKSSKPIKDLDRCYYTTSLDIKPEEKRSLFKIRDYYRQRWSVENQGFWVLTQRWNLDNLLSRSIDSIRSRINFVLQLYNIENCCAWKHPGSYDEEMHRLKRPQTGERLGQPSIMVYSNQGVMGAFQADEYEQMVKEAIKIKLKKALDAGEDINDILNNL